MGLLTTGHPVVSAVPAPPKLARRGRPRSGKVKGTVAVSESVAHRLKLIPDGTRGQTVERALVLVFDGLGVSGLDRLIAEMAQHSLRLQQSLELLARAFSLSEDARITPHYTALVTCSRRTSSSRDRPLTFAFSITTIAGQSPQRSTPPILPTELMMSASRSVSRTRALLRLPALVLMAAQVQELAG